MELLGEGQNEPFKKRLKVLFWSDEKLRKVFVTVSCPHQEKKASTNWNYDSTTPFLTMALELKKSFLCDC